MSLNTNIVNACWHWRQKAADPNDPNDLSVLNESNVLNEAQPNAIKNKIANPGNLFDPDMRAVNHAPVNQVPDPNSKRSRRKASRQQRQQRAASGWIYGGAKTKRRRRN